MTATELAPVHRRCDTQKPFDRGTKFPADQRGDDAQRHHVGGKPASEQAANPGTIPNPMSLPVRTQRAESIEVADTQATFDSAPPSGGSQWSCDIQENPAAAGSNPPTGQSPGDTQPIIARGGSTSTGTGAIGDAMPSVVPPRPGGFLRDPVLGVLADVLNDLEGVRIANANRVRILTRNEADGDGEERGHGLTEDNPEVAKLILTVKAMEQLEHDATLNLQRAMRKHPLGPFVKRTAGLGEKQAARLIATLGDPYWNDLYNRARTVSELWAYCGFHVLHPGGHGMIDAHCGGAAGVAPKRQRGQKSNWSEDARKRTWLIATSCMKQPSGNEYRDVYERARAKYADATHPADCVRCGPTGKPARTGSPLSAGHQHARALRLVSKAILRNLWIQSRDLHQEMPL